MSDPVNQLLDNDGSDYRQAKRYRRSPLLESVRPNPFDLLTRTPQSRFDGRESVNTQDWRFMTHAEPDQSMWGAMKARRRNAEDEAREMRRNMPFPPLAGRDAPNRLIRSIDYGQAAPEVSQQYQEAISTPQNQLLEEVMRSLAMSDSDQVAPNELDQAPLTMDQANEQMMRRAANVFNKQMRMRYPLERSAEGAGIPLP